MKILGIDPALSVTGYGVIECQNRDLSLVETGIISTSPKQSSVERLKKIYRTVTRLISDVKPDIIVLEKLYAHYRHPTTAYILGQARGVICLACAESSIPVVEYGATRVKKAVLGRGSASKNQIQRMVASTLKVNIKSRYTDVTDALALAIAHSYIIRSYDCQDFRKDS